MRTRNPNVTRATRITEGAATPLRAGGRLTLRDTSGNEAHPVSDILFEGAQVLESDGETAIVTLDNLTTLVGSVSAGGSPVTISSGTDHRAFPGVAWLDNPAATSHTAGDRFLVVYRHGTTHLTGGKIVGKIGTVTSTSTWAYTLGSEFDIEDVANDLRCEDAVSVLDIDGAGDYRVVIAAREYNGSVNLSPHVLVSAVSSSSFTSASSFTRYNVALSGHTQDFVVGRVHKLSGGRFMVVFGYISGTTHVNGVAYVSAVTDWSAPTFVNINNSTSGRDEINFEEMPSGTLYAHIRNDTTTEHESAASNDSGSTWTSPSTLYSASGWPMFRRLNSGIGLAVNRSVANTNDTYYRQTTSAATDTGWGAEVALDTTASYHSAYATGLQLDDNHFLVVYAVEDDNADPVDSDIYSQIFTDTSVLGGANILVSADDTTSGYLQDKLLAGTGISLTRGNAGANETLTVAVNDAPATEITVADSGGYFTGTTVEAALAELGAKRYAGEILVSDSPAGSPLVFSDLLQNEAGTDLLYADP